MAACVGAFLVRWPAPWLALLSRRARPCRHHQNDDYASTLLGASAAAGNIGSTGAAGERSVSRRAMRGLRNIEKGAGTDI